MAEIRRMRPLLGTFVEVGVHADAQASAQAAIDAAFDAVAQVHQRLSFHEPDSDLTRLNRSRGEAVAMHPLSLRVLRLAKAMMKASGQRFDVTIGGALVRRGALPDPAGGPLLEQGEADDLQLARGTAALRRPVRITLDGIAKGYAVDLAVDALRSRGIQAGWVNAGGDLRAFGDCQLPVQRREADRRLTTLGELRDAAIATSQSSCGETPWNPDMPALIVGQRHRICHGVFSVLARRAWRADALTKVACLASDEERGPLLQRLGGLLVAPTLAGAAA